MAARLFTGLGYRFKGGGRALLRWAILERVRVTGAILLFAGVLGVVLAMAGLVLPELIPAPAPEASLPEKRLKVELIDQLEFWIEEVDAEKQRGFALPARAIFVSEDILVEDGI